MTTKYRTDDMARWGAGLGRNLHADEVDVNFWEIGERVAVLEAAPSIPPAIEEFEVSGTSFLVHFTDDSVMGPYELPVAGFRSRGEWVAETLYLANDTVTNNGTLYCVLIDHTSEETFDPGANNGLGDDYYEAWLTIPGNSLPTGGATGQKLSKSSGSNFAVTWTWTFPTGTGNTGKYLRQASNTQDDVEWSGVLAEEVDFTPVTSSPLSSDTVADALEEIVTGGAMDANFVTYTPDTGSALTSENVADALNELGARGSIGKQTIWIPATAMVPLLTDGAEVAQFETSSWGNVVKTMNFEATDQKYAQFEIAMPKSWDKKLVSFRFYWSHPATTSFFDVAWAVETYYVNPGESLDTSLFYDHYFTDTGGLTDRLYVTDETDSSDTDFDGSGVLDNAILLVHVSRTPFTGDGDTMAVDARLHGVQLYYTTDAGSDD